MIGDWDQRADGRQTLFSVTTTASIAAGSRGDVCFRFRPRAGVGEGGRCWLFWDIRQEAGWLQSDDPSAGSFLTFHGPSRAPLPSTIRNLRTLDLYPEVPEFLGAAELRLDFGARGEGGDFELRVANWEAPNRPIDPFRFWLLDDASGVWEFAPTGYKSYHQFIDRRTGVRIAHDALIRRLSSVSLEIHGEYPAIADPSRRRTPGVLWGELHGMAFNQRPLDDFYTYAKEIAQLDFCAAIRFSYNTCVGTVWQETKDAAQRHTEPGRFVAFVGFECGTPDDDSHRCAYFPVPDAVPPIFCDSRPPARDPVLHRRFHPATVACEDLDHFYRTVRSYGGFVGGHHHTTTYDRELLAEMWQKQDPGVDEEERVYQYLRAGKRLGLVGGSDTHDSMPGNPDPEPGCPRPAGSTGVWADELTIGGLTEAFMARRVFATSGARILMQLESNGHPMGSELPLDAPRQFCLQIEGTAELSVVELLRDGRPWRTWTPGGARFQMEAVDQRNSSAAFYLVRVTQADTHKGWTSPIWFG